MSNLLVIAALALALGASSGCRSSAKEVAAAKENVRDANAELEKEREDASKTATENEWEIFKLETKLKIEKNDLRIAELRERKAEPSQALDSFYTKRISSLKERNDELRDRLNAYDKTGGDWKRFKREFSHDLDTLGRALEGFGEKTE